MERATAMEGSVGEVGITSPTMRWGTWVGLFIPRELLIFYEEY